MAFGAWRVARIAAHYPAPFYAGVLDHLGLGVGGGMYPMLVYVVEARRHQVAVEGPTVNGPWLSTPGDGSVRCGLRLLQGAIHPPDAGARARGSPGAALRECDGPLRARAAESQRAGALDRRGHTGWADAEPAARALGGAVCACAAAGPDLPAG